MRVCWTIAGLIGLGLVTAAGAAGMATLGDDDPIVEAEAGPSLAERLDELKDEYEAARRRYMSFYKGSTIPDEDLDEARKVAPDFHATARRIAEVASADPDSPAARDAMIWVIRQTGGYGDDGPYAGECALAGHWLVRHIGDDPDAVRLGLELDNVCTFNRDALLLNFFASAETRESEGLARLALAQYLQQKSTFAGWARKKEGRQMVTHVGVVRADGTLYDVTEEQTDASYAYDLHLKQCDPASLRDEAERLYAEVIEQYAEIPYLRARDRELQAQLADPEATWNGEPLTEEDRERGRRRLATLGTLGEAAEARLDAWRNIAAGEPAREIAGETLVGEPMRLSDYRGKVVALVFWGSWCGPCMRQVPREKELVERMTGRPFALLGVNVDEDKADALAAVEEHGITWPSWHDGAPGAGPIVDAYHVRSYPTVVVIDAEGTIRNTKAIGETLDTLVEQLVAEAEAGGE